jgi:Nucleotidyl transferase AbiEii toxin, Type IV TA system
VNPIFAAALEAQDLCRAKRWAFCFIGAVAVQRWGEPRLTQDVDLTVVTGFGAEEPYVDTLLDRFAGRRADAREFALRHRVVLLRNTAGVPIDVALGAIPFEERMVARASDFMVAPGATLRTCSAEDLVVLKAFAARGKDWVDIEGIAVRQAHRLDEPLIWRELDPLLELKGVPEAATRLRAILGRG